MTGINIYLLICVFFYKTY